MRPQADPDRKLTEILAGVPLKPSAHPRVDFVSQAVKEGGGVANDHGGGDDFIWWDDNRGTNSTTDDTHSLSWLVAHDQAYHWRRNSYNGPSGTYVTQASQLSIGDTIYYDFPDRNGNGDGILDHSAIVVAIQNGQPYVAYNTTDTCYRQSDRR